MVGRIMIDRTSDPASQENPVRKPGTVKMSPTIGSDSTRSLWKVSLRKGTRIVIPSQPQTTLGCHEYLEGGLDDGPRPLGATSDRNRQGLRKAASRSAGRRRSHRPCRR